MQLFSPDLPKPPTLYYSAGETHSLATLEYGRLLAMVDDLKLSDSEREHYTAGWLGEDSLVIIHNYREKRGTSNGFVLTREQRYRLSVQSIAFRVPKIFLWLSLRRKPRDTTLITYNTLGELRGPLYQYRHLVDKAVKRQLEEDWRAMNDYIGMACWQLENDRPLWRELMTLLTPSAVAEWVDAPIFAEKRLQKEGQFEGFWSGNIFIARCRAPHPALQLLWRDDENRIQPGYVYTALPDKSGDNPLPSLRIRPHRGETHYQLNAFDARHLQYARALLSLAEGVLNGMSPPLVEMMNRPDPLPDL
ncbi:hypothetical protein [Martelella alba]|uniref:Uncharacterized protein n=1 Tax=Martelella alba TaxID=2590451 RepID=A0ABY2SM33_9HYPH|nr:hypothetical protein [Martelella alba]TKI06703.1 hypothetical protein FCN80_08895 [Martelella alba]